MNVLIAEDNTTSRLILESVVRKWGFQVVAARDGDEAWDILKSKDTPELAVLDWMMPGLSGPEICRKLQSLDHRQLIYIILLTSRDSKQDIVVGLQAGADDYIIKPFDNEELHARLQVGQRLVELRATLSKKVHDLENAILEIKTLRGIVTICMHCHKIYNDQESWERLENYIEHHSEAQFSHGVCPHCMKEHYPEVASRKQKTSSTT